MQVNPLTREVLVKIVYYGPGLGGKTTSLSCVHQAAPPESRGQIVSLATPVDRTLYFDFLPVRMAPVSGHHVRLQLFTVPGQVYFNATRKLVLTGADGVMFVADSQRGRKDANVESLENLGINLEEQGRSLEDTPFVLALNKRDLEDVLPIEELEGLLSPRRVPSFATCARTGEGVVPALDSLVRRVLEDLEARGQLRPSSGKASEVVLARAEQPFEEQVGRLSEAHQAAAAPIAAPDLGGRVAHAEEAAEAMISEASQELHARVIAHASESRAESRAESRPESRAESRGLSLARELSNLSFASLFPRRVDDALSLEGDLATGALRSAIERADALSQDLLAETARHAGLPENSDAATLVLLLGGDGVRWLWFRRLLARVRGGGPIADRDALAAYSLLIDLRLRADRI